MLPLLLLACAPSSDFDLDGVWRFEVAVTETPEDACEERLLHNVSDALEDGDGEPGEEDNGWLEENDQSQSVQSFLGQFTANGDGWMLVVGGEMYPQEAGGDATTPSFAWTQSENTRQQLSHASGYSYVEESDSSAVTRVQISLPNEQQQKDARRTDVPVALEGIWSESDVATSSWEEADLWPEELELGETGAIPLGSYLTRLDELGYVVAASNGRSTADCGDDTCVLTVSSSCSESWTLAATQTGIEPGDEGWQDLEWAAGI